MSTESLDEPATRPFAQFAGRTLGVSPLRERIRAAIRRPEPECLPPLIAAAHLDAPAAARVRDTALRLARHVRALGPRRGVAGMIHEYSLSSEEGVALMCLAEALLRIPDAATRNALIRDKIAPGNWRAHLGRERTLFVNAATWGLMVSGRLTGAIGEERLASALTRLIGRGGEPLIRTGVDVAMRLMGEQFVTGETIGEALENSRRLEQRGFTYSYDMLGEAAATAADAGRYLDAYRSAIDAIGRAAAGRGPYSGPGISIKLSALHPRYRRAQAGRMMDELLPRLRDLAVRAKRYDIGFNIDAEEADRLDLSLDLFEALCFDPALLGWNGLGFVVQAYGKRCPFVIDWLIDLARRSGHRLMVRLVKGAYWDAEIKQAQVDGLDGYPVFTRKVYSDVSYLACARKLLDAGAEIFPQFATHNAQTVAAIYEMAGPEFAIGRYEFQCLHGMGEGLYGAVVGKGGLNRPCRIYAPVGTHGTLLAYLVRRLLENGANTSFVNRIADPAVDMDALIADPVDVARSIDPPGAPHPKLKLPADILGTRRNSAGIDLSDEESLARLGTELAATADRVWTARPVLAEGLAAGVPTPVRNPADRTDIVGSVHFAAPALCDGAFAGARAGWAPPAERAQLLRATADRLQAEMPAFIGLMAREAGKSAANAVAEVREAVDFLRYYADGAAGLGAECRPLGTVVCISPWNFPLSIFTGQVAAALAAGNAVIAKPAEESPLTAAAMIELFHAAGIQPAALQFLPGDGSVGAALCGHPAVAGVVFTGSTVVARGIQRQLAERVLPDGQPVPLIAETAGINAMIVDSSALTEQVVADVLSSAFDSAGQRCSALRLLCLQDDIAERTLTMIKGAMLELSIGNPDRLSTDVGPVITAEAADGIGAYVEHMRAAGRAVFQTRPGPEAQDGTFVPPTLIELESIDQLEREVFGPVLHVVRFGRSRLEAIVHRINALGYGLTFGLHTRIDETVGQVTSRIRAGNVYVNRNIIGAVVGVQPFGGRALSGTGPKAGGPLYLRRLLARAPAGMPVTPGATVTLPGPVGERNSYRAEPRGEVLLLPETRGGLAAQLALVRATGNRAVVDLSRLTGTVEELLQSSGIPLRQAHDWTNESGVDSVLVEGDETRMREVLGIVAGFDRQIVPVQRADTADPATLLHEVSVSINTAAAGGNASLMTLTES